MTIDPHVRFRIETAVFSIAMLGFCWAATSWQWFRTFDYAIYDGLVRNVALPGSDDVLIVGIDEQSLSRYGSWPWPRDLQAKLLEAINRAGPRAVFVDFVYGGESADSRHDRALVEAAAKIDILALPLIVDALATGRQLVEVMPFPDLLDTADVLGHVHVDLDADATARGVYLMQGVGEARWPHLALALANQLSPDSAAVPRCEEGNEFSLQNRRCGFVYLPFAGPPGSYAEISAIDLLGTSTMGDEIAGKIVLVGMTTTGAPDAITAPVSANDRPMSGVEFNANLLSALAQGRTINASSPMSRLTLGLAWVLFPVLLLPRMKAKAMLLSAAVFAALPLASSVVAFTVFDVHLPLAAAAATCLLSYPYWSWRRNEVAWQFVNAEFARLESERPRWVFAGQNLVTANDLERIESVLRARAVWYDAAPLVQTDYQVSVEAEDGRCLVLTREKSFDAKERAVADRLLRVLTGQTHQARELPGEVLSARIRKLEAAAEEVRTGREVGLRGLAEMPNGVAIISVLNRVLFVNQACRTLLSLPSDRLTMDLEDLTSGLVPPLGTTWPEISRNVAVWQQSCTFETTTGNATPVVVDGSPLADPGNVADTWVMTLTDMTDIHVAERDREEALAFLSHDLRSPMLSVQALLRGGFTESLLRDIERYTQKALSVSDQFVQLSRVQAREQFEVYELDLATVIDNAVDHVYPTAREKSCPVGFEPPQGLTEGAWIRGNGELLERAIVNLLSNAIKYSNAGSPITVILDAHEDEYAVTVADQGLGIPPEEVDSVFEPYFRSKNPRLAEQRGTGLGLRFVKTVIERHGGAVGVTSKLGKGSRFRVTLPRQGHLNG